MKKVYPSAAAALDGIVQDGHAYAVVAVVQTTVITINRSELYLQH